MGSGLEAVMSAVGRAWGWLLAFGIISLLVGLAVIFWPGETLAVVAVVFAVQLIVAAVFAFAAAFAIPGESGWLRALQALLAIISFVIGVYLVGHVALSLLVLAFLLGFYWVYFGVTELFLAIGHADLPGRGWRIASGILSIVAGGFVIVEPGISLFTLALVLGIWLIVFGVLTAIRAIQLRAATHALPSQAATA